MSLNIHSSQIPQAVIDQVNTAITQALNLLQPYAVTLTGEQRSTLPKMGEKTRAFVTDANRYAGQNPEFLPAFISKEEFDIDLADAIGLKGIHLAAHQLATAIDDTTMAAGSEAYTAALAYYNNVKMASAKNIGGAKDIFEALKPRFPGYSRKKTDE